MTSAVFVNDLLSISGQNPPYGNYGTEGAMIWQILESLRVKLSLRERAHRETEVGMERHYREQVNTKEKKKEKDSEDAVMTLILISEANRRAIEELSSDIDTALKVTRRAYANATSHQELAREGLEAIQRRAITLPDGRRVYFTRDGSSLRTEDGGAVTDHTLFAEVARLRLGKPEVSTYEDYAESWTRYQETTQRITTLAASLDRLDDLQRKVAQGLATEEEIAHVRGQLDELIASLPSDLSQEYEGLKSRQSQPVSYVDAGAEFASKLSASFTAVSIPKLPTIEPDNIPTVHALAYKPAPKF